MTVKKILTATSLQAESHQANTNSTPHGSSRNHTRVPTRMSDPNVKMVPTETKTSGSRATHTVRLADARICMDRVERCGHGKDFGHATRSVGNPELRQPRTSADGEACHGERPEPFARPRTVTAAVDRDLCRSCSYSGGRGDLVPAAVAGRRAVLVTAAPA